MPDHVKCAFQVRIQDCIEFFFRHPHDQIVPRDPGVIDKDINSAVFPCYCLYKGFTAKSVTLHFTVSAIPPWLRMSVATASAASAEPL